MQEKRLKPKPLISASHAVGWYWGNYLMNPNNALRDDEELMKKAYQELEEFRSKLKEARVTHQEFLDFIKIKGFHEKYYKYQKPTPTDCIICKRFGGLK